MDFDDDHDVDPDDDHDMVDLPPVSSSFDTPMLNSLRPTTGGGGSSAAAGRELVVSPVATIKPTTRYRACLKNHAVSLGAHAVDGCGEFMAAGEEGTLDALRCAACSCHRNFHRKESPDSGEAATATAAAYHHLQFSPYYRTPTGYLHHHHHSQQRPPLALPSTSGEDGEDASNPSSSAGKKRFRTKFTPEQKDKMLAFAERVGWRIQKHDEAAVQQFCTEACVKRHVLKVWMHNNKHTLGKKP